MSAYRKPVTRSLRIVFGEDTGDWAGTEVVIRSRLEIGDSLGLIPPLARNASKEERRRRVVDWGDAWLLSWNVEEPVLGPDGEQVLTPEGEPLWAPMPCDGEHLATTDPEFYMLVYYLHEQALAPQVVAETSLDPNSPGSSDSGANRGPSTEQISAAPNELNQEPVSLADATRRSRRSS